jgi:drug/metabolite transporter (DMT)-like permease
MGMVGVGLLLFSKAGGTLSFSFDPIGIAVVLLGAFLWSSGSLLSRTVPSPVSHAVSSGCAMMMGGIILFVIGGLMGEWSQLDLNGISRSSLFALAYLITFGSLIAFCSYTWLIQVERPTKVATCTFVNPFVAVILGWLLAGERLSPQGMLGGVVILGSVFWLWRPQGDFHGKASSLAVRSRT